MNLYIYLAIFITSALGLFNSKLLLITLLISMLLLGYHWWQKGKDYKPKSREFKELEKLKNKTAKKELAKHRFIEDQIAYICRIWGYNKTQKNITTKFIEQRAYGKIYTKLTASLLPQLILLIEECNTQNKKGCKAEVNTRLRELIAIMKEELKNSKYQKKESFETTLEVFDYLVKDI